MNIPHHLLWDKIRCCLCHGDRRYMYVFQGISLSWLFFEHHLSRGMRWSVTDKNWRPNYWRHQMETFSALLAICAGNSPVTGEFPAQGPVTRSFDVFVDPRLNKRLSKQSWGWWFETPSRPIWRHCNKYHSHSGKLKQHCEKNYRRHCRISINELVRFGQNRQHFSDYIFNGVFIVAIWQIQEHFHIEIIWI